MAAKPSWVYQTKAVGIIALLSYTNSWHFRGQKNIRGKSMLHSWSFQKRKKRKKQVEDIAEGKRKHNHTNAIPQHCPGQVENGKSWKEIQNVATRSELYIRDWQMDRLYCCPGEDWHTEKVLHSSLLLAFLPQTHATHPNGNIGSNTKPNTQNIQKVDLF